MISLSADDCQKLAETVLDFLNDVCLKLSKRVLYCNEVLSVVVLFLDLLIQTMVHSSLKDVRIICSLQIAGVRIEGGSILSKEFDLLLS